VRNFWQYVLNTRAKEGLLSSICKTFLVLFVLKQTAMRMHLTSHGPAAAF